MNTKKSSQIHTYIIYVLIYIFFASTLFLLLAQHFAVPGGEYYSDNPTHLQFVLQNSDNTYSLYHLIVSNIWKLLNNISFVNIFVSILTLSANLLAFLYTFNFIKKRSNGSLTQNKALLLTLALFLVSSIIIDFSPNARWYLGQGTPNPWHIITYSLQRPFSILAFSLLADVNDLIKKEKSFTKELIFFSIALTLSASLKPSFYFVFMPGAFIFFLIKLIASKFKLFKQCFLLGLSVVPAGLVLIYQNFVLFTSSENKIAISPSGELWTTYAIHNCVPLSILLGLAFPIFVTIVYIRKLDDSYKIALSTCIVSILQAYFVIEEGPRYLHANFFWGYYCGMALMFLVSATTFFSNKNKSIIIRIVGYILFLAHLACGIMYYLKLLNGGIYY